MIKYKQLLLLFSICLIVSACGEKAPDTYLWSGSQLKSVKKAIVKEDPKYTEAYKALLAKADERLQMKNLTVIDKPITPASGDKHDYMSLGRYWWPNPDTPDGLPYVRRDGHSNPELYKFDRDRLGNVASSVVDLSLAYYLSGNIRYANKAVSMLHTWFIDPATKMNPNMNFGQTIPGHNEGKGRAEGVIDTYSFVPMIDAIVLLQEEKMISPEDLAIVKQWFADYSAWMMESEIGLAEQRTTNNHSVAYDVQLAIFSLFADKKAIAEETITGFPERRIFAQIQPDGSQPRELARTTAMGYSTFNITHMLDMSDIGKKQGIDIYDSHSDDSRSIDVAIRFLTPYLGKSVEDFPYQQISNWDSSLRNLTFILYRAESYNPGKGYWQLAKTYMPDNPGYMFTLLYLK